MGCLSSKGDDEKEDSGNRKRPKVVKWSYDLVEHKKWSKPEKEEFKQRFGGSTDKMLEFLNTKGLVGETKVFLPGELDGYDITFEDCTDCDFYVLDITSQIQADNCTGCRFFCSPCSGSAFFRDCKNCSIAVACAQLRMRDCSSCRMMIFVPRQLTIESSKKTEVACWNVKYFGLAVQFARAQLSVYENGWYHAHDFSTNSMPTTLPSSTTLQDIMEGHDRPWKPLDQVAASQSPEDPSMDPIVPLVTGDRSNQTCFVLFSHGLNEAASKVSAHFSGGKGGALLGIAATRELMLREADLKVLFPGSSLKCPNRREIFKSGPVMAFLLTGAGGACGIVRSLLRSSGVCILGEEPADSAPDAKLGQVYIWDEKHCGAPAAYVLDTIRGDFDG
eukprot:TRINITY_DN9351_c0_g1_i4.p1 TRINITY_DN9351_c0_g1~~TRINITY_DN9351_c0_g1_i4.p1  ORF type:complete len:390 (+),score=78.35 TRINITY_DN9351_c0_g1_i4:145-1314(+)